MFWTAPKDKEREGGRMAGWEDNERKKKMKTKNYNNDEKEKMR